MAIDLQHFLDVYKPENAFKYVRILFIQYISKHKCPLLSLSDKGKIPQNSLIFSKFSANLRHSIPPGLRPWTPLRLSPQTSAKAHSARQCATSLASSIVCNRSLCSHHQKMCSEEIKIKFQWAKGCNPL